MKFSKNIFLSATLAVTALALVGCDGRRGSRGGDTPTFFVEDVTLNKVNTAKAKPTDVDAIRSFEFKLCLTDAVSHKAIERTDFNIGDGASEKEIKTDTSGCLLWTEAHKVYVVQKNRLLKIKRTVTGRGGFSGKIDVDLALDPWDEAGSLYFLRADKFSPSNVEPLAQNMSFDQDLTQSFGLSAAQADSAAADTIVSDVSLSFRGRDKDNAIVTPLLTLKPSTVYELSFAPKFGRKNLFDERSAIDLRGNEFDLKIALFREPKNFTDNFQPQAEDLVAEYQGPVYVDENNSTVTQPIRLRIHDISGSQSRTRLVMILKPTGTAAAIVRPGLFQGTLQPLKNNADASAKLVSEERRTSSLMASVELILDQVAKVPKASKLIAEDKQFVPDDQGKLLGVQASASQVADLSVYCDKLYTADQVVDRQISKWKRFLPWNWYNDKEKDQLLSSCKSNPSAYIALETRDVVENVAAARLVSTTIPKKISVSRSLSYSVSQTDTTGSDFSTRGGVSGGLQVGVSAQAGLSTPGGGGGAGLEGAHHESPAVSAASLLPVTLGASANASANAAVRLNISKEWYYASSFSKATGDTSNATVQQVEELESTSQTYALDIDSRRCVFAKGLNANQTIYSCETGSTRKTIQETYYLVGKNVDATGFNDPDGADGWHLVIRGVDTYASFEKMMSLENAVLNFSSLMGGANKNAPLLPDFYTSQFYPGVTSSSGR